MLLICKVPLGSAQTINNTVHTRLLIKKLRDFSRIPDAFSTTLS